MHISKTKTIAAHALQCDFLRDFFGFSKYLEVLLLLPLFRGVTVYGMKCTFLSPSSLLYLTIAYKHINLFLVLAIEGTFLEDLPQLP